MGGTGRRQRDPRSCEGVVQRSGRNQSAATPGSGSSSETRRLLSTGSRLAAGFRAAANGGAAPPGALLVLHSVHHAHPGWCCPAPLCGPFPKEVASLASGPAEAAGREKKLREGEQRWEVGRRLASQISPH